MLRPAPSANNVTLDPEDRVKVLPGHSTRITAGVWLCSGRPPVHLQLLVCTIRTRGFRRSLFILSGKLGFIRRYFESNQLHDIIACIIAPSRDLRARRGVLNFYQTRCPAWARVKPPLNNPSNPFFTQECCSIFWDSDGFGGSKRLTGLRGGAGIINVTSPREMRIGELRGRSFYLGSTNGGCSAR